MDAVAALSVVCGVIQIVDFGTKVVSKCREIHKTGTSSENRELVSMTTRLQDLSKAIGPYNDQLHHSNLPAQLSDDDRDILELARECSGTADELVAELHKLQVQDPIRKRDAVKKTFKILWKKSTIDGIQNRLEKYQKTLDTRILINLR